MLINEYLNQKCYQERIFTKLTLIIRSCYTQGHYLSVSNWITNLYLKRGEDVPRGINLELYQLSRKIPSIQRPRPYDNFFSL